MGRTVSIFLEASAILVFRVDRTWAVDGKGQVVHEICLDEGSL